MVGNILGIAGLLAGGVFFVLSGRQLRDEAARLRRLHESMLRIMEAHGLTLLERDASGRLTGKVSIPVPVPGVSAASGGGEIRIRPVP